MNKNNYLQFISDQYWTIILFAFITASGIAFYSLSQYGRIKENKQIILNLKQALEINTQLQQKKQTGKGIQDNIKISSPTEIVHDLSVFANQNNILIQSIKPQSHGRINSFQISLRGHYAGLVGFIYHLESSPSLAVTAFSLEKEMQKKDLHLNITFHILAENNP